MRIGISSLVAARRSVIAKRCMTLTKVCTPYSIVRRGKKENALSPKVGKRNCSASCLVSLLDDWVEMVGFLDKIPV